jgi:hypothetical protein
MTHAPVITDETLQQALLEKMGYNQDCCKKCKHFVPTDCSGRSGALSAHCNINPPIKIFKIDELGMGSCDLFDPLDPSPKPGCQVSKIS